jgi:hypothetical protein
MGPSFSTVREEMGRQSNLQSSKSDDQSTKRQLNFTRFSKREFAIVTAIIIICSTTGALCGCFAGMDQATEDLPMKVSEYFLGNKLSSRIWFNSALINLLLTIGPIGGCIIGSIIGYRRKIRRGQTLLERLFVPALVRRLSSVLSWWSTAGLFAGIYIGIPIAYFVAFFALIAVPFVPDISSPLHGVFVFGVTSTLGGIALAIIYLTLYKLFIKR